jgi:hypothetical protein
LFYAVYPRTLDQKEKPSIHRVTFACGRGLGPCWAKTTTFQPRGNPVTSEQTSEYVLTGTEFVEANGTKDAYRYRVLAVVDSSPAPSASAARKKRLFDPDNAPTKELPAFRPILA